MQIGRLAGVAPDSREVVMVGQQIIVRHGIIIRRLDGIERSCWQSRSDDAWLALKVVLEGSCLGGTSEMSDSLFGARAVAVG